MLKCNYHIKKLDKNLPSFYLQIPEYFKELRLNRQDKYKSDLVLWNNEDITTEGKSLFWKSWTENGIYYIQDILNENGKFFTYEEFNRKYKIKLNFLNYFQILSSIPANLKSKAASTPRPMNFILDYCDIFDLSKDKSIQLSKMKCKDYYHLLKKKKQKLHQQP